MNQTTEVQAPPAEPEKRTGMTWKEIKVSLILILVGGLLLYLGVQEGRLMFTGERITGTIESHKRSTAKNSDRFHTYTVTYRYSYKGERYTGTYTKRAYDTSEISAGTRVDVTVLPGAPGTSRLTSALNPLFVLLKAIGGLTLAVFSLVRLRQK